MGTQVVIPALLQQTPNDYNPIANVKCVIKPVCSVAQNGEKIKIFVVTDDTKEIVDQSENIKKYLKKVTGTMTELFDIVFYHEAQVGADFDNFEAIKSTRNETLEMALSDFKNICDQ